MRVTVDLTPTLQTQAGLGRYAAELTQALHLTLPADEQLELFYIDPQRRHPPTSLPALPAHCLPFAAKPWRFRVMLAHWLRRPQNKMVARPDVFIATDHLQPYLPKTITLFTLGDTTFLSHAHTHARLNRTYLKWMMPIFLKHALAVVAISQATLADGIRQYPFIAGKGHVVYPAVGEQFSKVDNQAQLQTVRAKYHLPADFVLYVGTLEPRKNLPMLLEAFKQAQPHLNETKLVIAGKKGWLYNQIFTQLQTLGLEDKVIFTGYIPDEDLPTLYSLATAFVYPSIYEGFGLPVLEAMACGTPVICSNTSSLPEVAGQAAILFAPDDERGWAEAITQVIQNAALRTDLRQRGLSQAAGFTWATAAEKIRQLYRELYAHFIGF
jgi:glycosyltransferase involved in cell wall biosynthesis